PSIARARPVNRTGNETESKRERRPRLAKEPNADFLVLAPSYFAVATDLPISGKRQEKFSRYFIGQPMGKPRPAGGNILDPALAKRPSLGRIEKSNRVDFLAGSPPLVGGHHWPP